MMTDTYYQYQLPIINLIIGVSLIGVSRLIVVKQYSFRPMTSVLFSLLWHPIYVSYTMTKNYNKRVQHNNCVGRELNPDLLLGRQQCYHLYTTNTFTGVIHYRWFVLMKVNMY